VKKDTGVPHATAWTSVSDRRLWNMMYTRLRPYKAIHLIDWWFLWFDS